MDAVQNNKRWALWSVPGGFVSAQKFRNIWYVFSSLWVPIIPFATGVRYWVGTDGPPCGFNDCNVMIFVRYCMRSPRLGTFPSNNLLSATPRKVVVCLRWATSVVGTQFRTITALQCNKLQWIFPETSHICWRGHSGDSSRFREVCCQVDRTR